MTRKHFNTLCEATNALAKEGYSADFIAGDTHIVDSKTKVEYTPKDLEIVGHHRFEGMSNPQDDTVIFALQASDGNRGTLIMSHSAEHSQNVDLIKRIPQSNTKG